MTIIETREANAKIARYLGYFGDDHGPWKDKTGKIIAASVNHLGYTSDWNKISEFITKTDFHNYIQNQRPDAIDYIYSALARNDKEEMVEYLLDYIKWESPHQTE